MLLAHWANAKPIVTVVVVPVHIAGIEVHVPRVVRGVRVERTRPIVAVAACIVERTVVAVARGGERKRLGAGRRCGASVVYFFSRQRECAVQANYPISMLSLLYIVCLINGANHL